MTDKIYYQDAAAKTAMANVLETGIDAKGHYAVLDRSCFYPEGGGQPADKGVIGQTEVTDVQALDGEIRHYIAGRLEAGEYEISIDWERRFDHMQQHTGQHLLSAIFEDELGMPTKSFHLGTERVSIDLDVSKISADQIKIVEKQVNSLIYSQLPIETEWVAQEQAMGMKLRKKPAVHGDIRLVKIADIDINACGGTHLSNTAQLGLLKIIRTEKAKGGTRVYFLSGKRAMEHFDLLQSVTDQLTISLNAPAAGLAEAAEAVLNDRKAKDKQLKNISLEYMKLEAENMKPEETLIIRDFSGRPFKDVQQLAKLTAEKHDSSYLLFFISEEENTRFVCAKGKNAPGNMKQVLGEILEDAGGNVGGKENLAQGGIRHKGGLDAYSAAFRDLVEKIT
ncbi:DHHA1 domain-containing protein [Planococcus sp. MERTA32b]|nr:DHHA1 domain-containing protein [Planococcus sp. MER TA 32b]